MAFPQRMGEFAGHLNEGVKSTTRQSLLWLFKCLSGAVIGLTLALIGQEIVGYGTFSLVFVLVSVTGAFCRFSAKWKLATLLIFDLVMVLFALLLRMYILVAPGM